MPVKPQEPIHRIEDVGDGMKITIPYRISWIGIPVQLAWLFIWFVAGISMRTGFPLILRLLTAIPWLVGLALGLYSLVRALSGGEVLELTASSITRYYRVLGFSWPRQYLAEHIKDLRLASKRREVKGNELAWLTAIGNDEANVLAFDYGAKTIRVASGLEEAEGKQILAAVRQRYPQYLEDAAGAKA